MSCPVCNTSPCICGDSYYKLTDEGFLAHLSIIKRIAKDRGFDVKIDVNGVDIDVYNDNVNVIVEANVSLTGLLSNFMQVPEYYKKRLERYKGLSAIVFIEELKEDFDFIGFPLLLAIMAVTKDNHTALRKGLVLNFYNSIVNIDYELNPPTVPCAIDDFFKNSRNAEDFGKCVYLQRNAYTTLLRDAKDGAQEFTNVLRKYNTGMRCVEEILTMDYGLINHAIEFLCTSLPNGEALYKQYVSSGVITNQLRDELQNANYAFCKEYSNVIVGDLKV